MGKDIIRQCAQCSDNSSPDTWPADQGHRKKILPELLLARCLLCAQHLAQHHPSLCPAPPITVPSTILSTTHHCPQYHPSLCPAPSSAPPIPCLISFDPTVTYEGRRDDLYSWLQRGCVKAHMKNKGWCLAAIFCPTSLHLSSGAERMGMLFLKAFVGINLAEEWTPLPFHSICILCPHLLARGILTGDSLHPLPLLSHTSDIYEAATVEKMLRGRGAAGAPTLCSVREHGVHLPRGTVKSCKQGGKSRHWGAQSVGKGRHWE